MQVAIIVIAVWLISTLPLALLFGKAMSAYATNQDNFYTNARREQA